MNSITSREFPISGDFWQVVEQWAEESGFRLRASEEKRRLYRKGGLLLMAPAFVDIRRLGKNRVRLEAWVKADPFILLSVLAARPSRMAIESGGISAALPRRRARDAVNRLLFRLGQYPIP